MKTLTVKASGMALVTDYEALKSGVRRFIGRQFDPSHGPAGGWPMKTEPSEIPYRHEYKQALVEGDLLPANKETAAHCGLPYNTSK